MKKDGERETGFWADVRELRGLIKLKVAQGHGAKSLAEAMKEQLRQGSVQTVETKSLEKGLKGLPPALAEVVSSVPPGQQLKLSAAEYRNLVDRK
jgi:hypothetical protein